MRMLTLLGLIALAFSSQATAGQQDHSSLTESYWELTHAGYVDSEEVTSPAHAVTLELK